MALEMSTKPTVRARRALNDPNLRLIASHCRADAGNNHFALMGYT
jgi:hypothetical protein